MSKNRIWMFLAIVGVAGIAGAALSERNDSPSEPALVAPSSVVAVQASWGSSYARTRYFSGRAEASKTTRLGFEQSGTLFRVLVDEGDVVARDELLALLDTRVLAAQRAELEAQLVAAKADATITERTYHRFREIVAEGGVSRQALDEAHEAWLFAKARVEVVWRQIESNGVWLAKSELRAPFDGVIVDRLADEGQVMQASAELLRLQQLGPLSVRIGVSGGFSDRLEVSREYGLRWGQQQLQARLYAIMPRRDERTRTVDALFELVDPGGSMRPGDMFELRLDEQIWREGFWLPLSALHEGARGLWSVYVVSSQASPTALRRSVEVLSVSGDRAYLNGFVGPGEWVVVKGTRKLVPGVSLDVTRRTIAPSDQHARVTNARAHGS